MSETITRSFKTGVPVWKQIGPNDVRRVDVPCFVAVTVDITRLIDKLGEKALKSKGKRATAFHGALIVEVKECPEDLIVRIAS